LGFIKGFFSNLFVGIDQVEGIRQSFRCPAIVTPQVSGERLKIQKLLINHLKIRYSTLLKSEIPDSISQKVVVHPPSNLFGNLVTLYRLRSNQDTDRITYRCFLPDLTRFMTACCVASNQNGPRVPSIRSLGGNSAPHKRISGKGHR